MFRYENTVTGQVVESEHPVDYLEGVARWTVTEVQKPKRAVKKEETDE